MRILLSTLIATYLLIAGASALAMSDSPPARTDDNVVVGFYNIKWMGSTPHDFSLLAKVIQHFDVCAVVEVRKERALRELVNELEALTGKDWGFAHGVRTHRPNGNYYESYGVLWRKDRVQLGDGLVSGVWDWNETFRNDPYLASFKAGQFTFTVLAIHTRYNDDSDGTRAQEVAAIGEQVAYLRNYLEEDDILLGGDFNYSAENQHMKNMAMAADLHLLDINEKTTFKTNGEGYASAYDHIYGTPSVRDLMIGQAQALNATLMAYGEDTKETRIQARSELSDHVPVFVVLRLPSAP